MNYVIFVNYREYMKNENECPKNYTWKNILLGFNGGSFEELSCPMSCSKMNGNNLNMLVQLKKKLEHY